MIEKRVALLVLSISSTTIWELLFFYNLVSPKILTALILMSMMVFVYSVYYLLIDFKFESKYLRFFLYLFLFYELIVIARGWAFSYDDIKNYLQASYVFWPFIIPLFVFFDKRLSTIGYLIKWIYYLAVFYLIIFMFLPALLMSRVTAETLVSTTYVCGFLLLNSRFLNNKKVSVTFLLLLISLLSLIYLARRNGIVTIGGFILAGYFVNLWNKSKAFIYKVFPIIIFSAIILLFSLTTFTKNLSERLQARLTEDTRSTLYRNFIVEISDNFVFGRGMNGEYYFPSEEQVIDNVVENEVEYRHIIENGFLQLLLTGGIVQIVLFLMLLLPAAFFGIFKSSNQLTMACGFMIFLWIVDMFIFGLPRLSLHYILIWICVGICFKPSIRRMKNAEISEEFKKLKFFS